MATEEKKNDPFYGSHSLFLTVQNCRVINCSFKKNKGFGGAVNLSCSTNLKKKKYRKDDRLLSKKVRNLASDSAIYYHSLIMISFFVLFALVIFTI